MAPRKHSVGLQHGVLWGSPKTTALQLKPYNFEPHNYGQLHNYRAALQLWGSPTTMGPPHNYGVPYIYGAAPQQWGCPATSNLTTIELPHNYGATLHLWGSSTIRGQPYNYGAALQLQASQLRGTNAPTSDLHIH